MFNSMFAPGPESCQ